MNYILKFEGNTINYLDHDILVLLNAISNVDKQYLSYAEYNANAEDRKDQINQLERVFAYELYYQWSLLKDDNMVLNGEIGKLWNDKYWYPDLVLHGGQGDPENNRVVVEIKRECMVKGNYKVILEDFKKLSSFLKSEEKSSQDDCKFRNYKNAVLKAKDIDTVVTGRVTGHPVQVLKNKLANEFLKLERQNADIEEIEALGRGALAKAVKEGDADWGSLMSGQIAGMVNKKQTASEIIEEMFAQYNEIINGIRNGESI